MQMGETTELIEHRDEGTGLCPWGGYTVNGLTPPRKKCYECGRDDLDCGFFKYFRECTGSPEDIDGFPLSTKKHSDAL